MLLFALTCEVRGQSAMGISRPKKTTKKEMEDFFDFKTRTNVKSNPSKDYFTSPRRSSRTSAMGDYFTQKKQRRSPSRGGGGSSLAISNPGHANSNKRQGDYFSNSSAKAGSGTARGGDMFARKKKAKYIRREPQEGLLPKKMYWYKPKKRDKSTPIKRSGEDQKDSQ